MDETLSRAIIIVVASLLVFAALQPILPTTEQTFSELSVLGPNQTQAGYPTNVTAGRNFLLYGHIGNHKGAVGYYQVLVELGSQDTRITSSTAANAPLITEYSSIVDTGHSTTFPMNITIGHAGVNQKLIFELWSYNVTSSQFEYTGITDQLLINAT